LSRKTSFFEETYCQILKKPYSVVIGGNTTMKKNKKTTKTTAKTATKKTASKKNTKFSMINELHEAVMNIATASKNGQIKVKRSDLKNAVEGAFMLGAKKAASGERVRFPVIGVLARRDVKARKAGKGVNPFTGEEITIKARPESKKPRWSFPKTIKETFADKKNW
jgi:nucleoid DNA-binding protein